MENNPLIKRLSKLLTASILHDNPLKPAGQCAFLFYYRTPEELIKLKENSKFVVNLSTKFNGNWNVSVKVSQENLEEAIALFCDELERSLNEKIMVIDDAIEKEEEKAQGLIKDIVENNKKQTEKFQEFKDNIYNAIESPKKEQDNKEEENESNKDS